LNPCHKRSKDKEAALYIYQESHIKVVSILMGTSETYQNGTAFAGLPRHASLMQHAAHSGAFMPQAVYKSWIRTAR